GGIGTSSRRLPASLGGYTVGVLVQTNFGGVLTIAGAPVGVELGRYYLKDQVSSGRSESSNRTGPSEPSELSGASEPSQLSSPDGSVIIIIATDAPVDARNLGRIARRAIMGLARTGSSGSNGSGDYCIAFSTAAETRIPFRSESPLRHPNLLSNDAMSPLF